MNKHQHAEVTSRNESFTQKPSTKIWFEKPAPENPFIAQQCRCHGYDFLELMQKKSYVEVLYLLFRGELPTPDELQLLDKLMIGLINPGPRHPATRAGMNAAVGKTDPVHVLPISLIVMGGEHLGAGEIEASMRFLRANRRQDPEQVAESLIQDLETPMSDQNQGDIHIAPGFGTRFGGIDIVPQQIAQQLLQLPGSGKLLQWGQAFAQALTKHQMGWLSPGIAAAVFADLGFHPRYGGGLYQLLTAPGLLAHSMEFANKPITAMPFVSDENYFIESTDEQNTADNH